MQINTPHKGNNHQKIIYCAMLPLNKYIFHSTIITDEYFQQMQTIDDLHNALGF